MLIYCMFALARVFSALNVKSKQAHRKKGVWELTAREPRTPPVYIADIPGKSNHLLLCCTKQRQKVSVDRPANIPYIYA